jgi:hypothetical protein
MSRIASWAIVTMFGIGIIGCGKDSATDTPQENTSTSTAPPSANPAPNTEAVSQAAADFVDAVLKGDKDRAIARLTPKAVDKIVASGKHFGPPGEKGATFRIGPVHMRTANQAVVPFVVSDEQMCCVMALVGGDWRVSGLAYRRGPNQPWTSTDFETGRSLPIALPAGRPASAERQASTTAPRPSPPRTGEQAPADMVR